MIHSSYLALRKALVLIVGISVVVVGIVMLVTPGPDIVIPAGIAILATEFLWAKRLLDRVKQSIARHAESIKSAHNHEKK